MVNSQSSCKQILTDCVSCRYSTDVLYIQKSIYLYFEIYNWLMDFV